MILTDKETTYLKALGTTRKTIYELADEFGIHYQTVLSQIRLMQAKGYVKEYPIRKGRAKLYFATFDPDSNEPLPKLPVVISNGEKYEITSLVVALSKTTSPNLDVKVMTGSILAHLSTLLFEDDKLFGTAEEYRGLFKKFLGGTRHRLELLEELYNREELWNGEILKEMDNWQSFIGESDLKELASKMQSTLIDEMPAAKKRWDKHWS